MSPPCEVSTRVGGGGMCDVSDRSTIEVGVYQKTTMKAASIDAIIDTFLQETASQSILFPVRMMQHLLQVLGA